MLIGIIQHAPKQRGDFSPGEYQYEILERRDLLPKTNTISTHKSVLETLRTFEQEWHRHQQFLVPFDVCQSTGLCMDVVIEISKYLSLTDTLNAFSLSVLPLLRETHSKVHLNNPSKRLLQTITGHLDARQIVSLHISDDIHTPVCDFSALQKFQELVFVTIHSPRWQETIGYLLDDFPRLRRLSLWFDKPLDATLFGNLRGLLSFTITHLRIRCAGVLFDDRRREFREGADSKNKTITSFIFDSTYNQVNQNRTYLYGSALHSCFEPPMMFISFLSDVQRVRLVIHRDEIKSTFRIGHWETLIRKCRHLNRVSIHLADSEEFTQGALNIEQTLRLSRPEMIFRIKNLWFDPRWKTFAL